MVLEKLMADDYEHYDESPDFTEEVNRGIEAIYTGLQSSREHIDADHQRLTDDFGEYKSLLHELANTLQSLPPGYLVDITTAGSIEHVSGPPDFIPSEYLRQYHIDPNDMQHLVIPSENIAAMYPFVHHPLQIGHDEVMIELKSPKHKEIVHRSKKSFWRKPNVWHEVQNANVTLKVPLNPASSKITVELDLADA